jgi:uncharacterized LabA/DUF88 family protein
MFQLSTENTKSPVCVYIDGFNLYHASAQYDDPYLKWLNFRTLAESFCKTEEFLEQVYFFTAVATWNRDKELRHRNFIRAQKAKGVRVIESKFTKNKKFCIANDRYCKQYEEKQTDVSIAVTLLSDAVKNRMNRAILITADSDQVPLARAMKELFPAIGLTLAAPPGRASAARELGNEISHRVPITLERLHGHHLPKTVLDEAGKVVAQMPELYREQLRAKSAPAESHVSRETG